MIRPLVFMVFSGISFPLCYKWFVGFWDHLGIWRSFGLGMPRHKWLRLSTAYLNLGNWHQAWLPSFGLRWKIFESSDGKVVFIYLDAFLFL
jgi:hypothetical protein